MKMKMLEVKNNNNFYCIDLVKWKCKKEINRGKNYLKIYVKFVL